MTRLQIRVKSGGVMDNFRNDPDDGFWVFGYGSLMWRPGFAHVETRKARLSGYRRALCIHSYVHRGTEARSGLVLGLDRGGSTLGMAFRVLGSDGAEVLAYLRERELVTNVYLERTVPVVLDGGERVASVTYVVDRGHRQYAGRLSPEDAAARVRGAEGLSGRNEEYVANTLVHLRSMGIRDHWLEEVGRLLDLD